jgi:two-component system phosphate regulon sensor histidine kinase PhoR
MFINVFKSSFEEQQKLKKNLTENITHELKTPISAIKIYAELLEEENKVSDGIKKYVKIINENANRLANIISDLSLLSQTENRPHLDIDEFYVKEIFDEMDILFQNKANSKNLKLVFSFSENLKLKTDKFKITAILSNLIDNALKYTEKGQVDVFAESKNGKNTVFKICDTGLGIAEKHINKIFERFYVVDKSRSRKTGGTGLGLSIVKHMVELLRGSIKVKSIIGKGSAFIVDIKNF